VEQHQLVVMEKKGKAVNPEALARYEKVKEKEKRIRQFLADNPEQDQVRKYIESKGIKFSSLDTKNPSFPRSILPPEAETPKVEPKKAEAPKTEEKKTKLSSLNNNTNLSH